MYSIVLIILSAVCLVVSWVHEYKFTKLSKDVSQKHMYHSIILFIGFGLGMCWLDNHQLENKLDKIQTTLNAMKVE